MAPFRIRSTSLAILAFLWACSSEPAPNGRFDAHEGTDAAALDLGDTTPDTGAAMDAEPVDLGAAPDAAAPDAEPVDVGGFEDAMPADMGPADAGAGVPDQDNDGISDADEGDGQVDTDNDGTPDSMDADSDNDGIPDSVEAGDTNPSTPPRDTDHDGTPDFRDSDSDNDGIPDMVEGTGDPDHDGLGNYVDPDSDGDGIPDMVEGTADTDTDTTPNYLDLDSDGDGISDQVEGTGDPDADTTPNYLDADSDGDGIPDLVEGAADPDHDGLGNFVDTDSDGDGIPDMVEGTADPDMDGTPNYLDTDSDGDLIADSDEGTGDPDMDGTPNYLDTDSDGDGLSDLEESGDQNVATAPVDHDLDGVADYLDLDSDNDTIGDRDEGTADSDNDTILDRLDIDSDNDGILDAVEAGDTDLLTAPIDTDHDGTPDFRDLDSDGDTILDLSEGLGDPNNNSVPNYRDLDSDGDGIPDASEAGDNDPATPPIDTDHDFIPDYLDRDSDGDGLADGTEPGCPGGPNRLLADSDGDGFLDPAEIAFGSNPCSAASGITGFYFILPPNGPNQTAPLNFSNTGIDRADVAIEVDTTGSMTDEITNIRTSLSNLIIPGIAAVIPDSAFGVSSFEDVPISPFGDAASGDVPFQLRTRVTTDRVAAQNAVNQLAVRDGLDLPEAGLLSLYQIATGVGLTWPGGAVAPFDPNAGRIPNVADGTIGGVGFRTDALPIIVHVTDAPAHERADYLAVNNQIGAPDTSVVASAISGIGARIIGIANSRLPHDPYAQVCTRGTSRIFGTINMPVGTDVDWFVVQTTSANAVIHARSYALEAGNGLDTMVAVYNSAGTQLGISDDLAPTDTDSDLSVTVGAAGTYYVALTAYGDTDFNGSGGGSTGYYWLEVSVNGGAYDTSVTQCRSDDGNARGTATPLVPFAQSTAAPSASACISACNTALSPWVFPSGMATETGSLVPTCAWDQFGAGRPAGCAANQCCTGQSGAGVAPNADNLCPLSFQIDDAGVGLSQALVSGVQALVRFSTFTVTTQVRPDPVELAASGFDTTCFLHGVIPVSATPPGSCSPMPRIADLLPPVGVNDSFENVTPGTQLTFNVNAQNQDAMGAPCRNELPDPQLFRAYIDVVADGVTVLDTRDVIIIVPPAPPGGGN
ncbi:MAG: hypothetical protein U1E65_36245 [Myxococcota bacterium]